MSYHPESCIVIMASDEQLELLSLAKAWYADGTLWVVKKPVSQLFSIHAFAKKEGELKQVPLVSVVMSRRLPKDYIRVLQAMESALPRRPRVQSVVADLELACWLATKLGIVTDLCRSLSR